MGQTGGIKLGFGFRVLGFGQENFNPEAGHCKLGLLGTL